jgi:hypothetical protein
MGARELDMLREDATKERLPPRRPHGAAGRARPLEEERSLSEPRH